MNGVFWHEWTMCDIEMEVIYCWVGVLVVVFKEVLCTRLGLCMFFKIISRGGLVCYDAPFTQVRSRVQLTGFCIFGRARNLFFHFTHSRPKTIIFL